MNDSRKQRADLGVGISFKWPSSGAGLGFLLAGDLDPFSMILLAGDLNFSSVILLAGDLDLFSVMKWSFVLAGWFGVGVGP